MSQDDSEQNKSEQPSPYKLSRAREKGSVARGMDLGFFTGLTAAVVYLWMNGRAFVGQLAEIAHRALIAAPSVLASPNEILAVTGAVMGAALKPVALLIGAVFLVVLAFEVAQTGPVFSTQPLKMDFNRLNPATGLKRVFSVRMLIETAKNVLKMVVYTALAFMTVRVAVETIAPSITDASSLIEGARKGGARLLLLFMAAAVVFAAIDQFIVRRDFLKKMRMSRREVRREAKDREGDPRLKNRRRQLHREFASSSESIRGIRGSDVLITNPTHFAVALKYDPATMDAPHVVSRGAHQFALRLRRLAFLYGVTIVPNPPLARALFRCELNKPVPEALYQPIADIYRALREQPAAQPADPAHV